MKIAPYQMVFVNYANDIFKDNLKILLLMSSLTVPSCTESGDCENGGTCFDGVCHCKEHYLGSNCETGRKCIFFFIN